MMMEMGWDSALRRIEMIEIKPAGTNYLIRLRVLK
jgi:hypothetical protein